MRLGFMGTPDSAVPTLRRLINDGHKMVAVWTQPDRPAGRGNKLHVPPVKEFALSRGLTVHQPSKIRTDDALELFKSHDADAAILVAYGRILPSSFLKTPRRGCLNVHFSLLPKYRGAAPVNWAIVCGESVSGVTTMQIDEGLDTGAILLQAQTEIGEKETAPELMSRLSEVGAGLMSETLKLLDEIVPRKQDDSRASFAPVLKREDGLIDWSWDAAEIERRVRGFQPWPHAFTTFHSRRLIIWRASVVSDVQRAGNGGDVIEAHGDRLIVACGNETLLQFNEVQPEGKKRMLARDFLNGTHLRAGDRFG